MYYSKYDQLGGLVDFNFMRCDTCEVAATKRKLSRMSLVDSFFYCRHLELTYPDTVGFSMVTIKAFIVTIEKPTVSGYVNSKCLQ